jgi:hypothetical protein
MTFWHEPYISIFIACLIFKKCNDTHCEILHCWVLDCAMFILAALKFAWVSS